MHKELEDPERSFSSHLVCPPEPDKSFISTQTTDIPWNAVIICYSFLWVRFPLFQHLFSCALPLPLLLLLLFLILKIPQKEDPTWLTGHYPKWNSPWYIIKHLRKASDMKERKQTEESKLEKLYREKKNFKLLIYSQRYRKKYIHEPVGWIFKRLFGNKRVLEKNV